MSAFHLSCQSTVLMLSNHCNCHKPDTENHSRPRIVTTQKKLRKSDSVNSELNTSGSETDTHLCSVQSEYLQKTYTEQKNYWQAHTPHLTCKCMVIDYIQ